MALRGFVAVREGFVLNSFILNLKFEYIKYSLPMWGFSGIMTNNSNGKLHGEQT